MAKPKPTLESMSRKLSSYKFDTSHYILLRSPVRRDPATGQLTDKKHSKPRPKTVPLK